MNLSKTDFICLKREGIICGWSVIPVKLADQSIYLGNNISSTESDVNMHIAKVWTTYGNLISLIKWNVSSSSYDCVSTTIWTHHLDSNEKHVEKSFMWTSQKRCMLFWINLGSNTPQNSSCTATSLPSYK